MVPIKFTSLCIGCVSLQRFSGTLLSDSIATLYTENEKLYIRYASHFFLSFSRKVVESAAPDVYLGSHGNRGMAPARQRLVLPLLRWPVHPEGSEFRVQSSASLYRTVREGFKVH